MPLLVLALRADQTGSLTLDEWDALRSCAQVWFEDVDHPLIERLRAAGVTAAPYDEDLEPATEDAALVVEPGSTRLVDLASRGARLLGGPAPAPDDLSAAHAAPVLRDAIAAFGELVTVMARLRSADGCPWDQQQTHESLRAYLLEETYEVIDTIERGEVGDELEEELGDVLLQVVFHARLAEQDERFDIAEVATRLVAKLIYRHPHVFGDTTVRDAQEVLRNWETLKAEEKQRTDPFEGIPAALPALVAAAKTQKRAARLGFDPQGVDVRERVLRALDSREADALGDALFWLVAAARGRGLDPEAALRGALARFRASFSA